MKYSQTLLLSRLKNLNFEFLGEIFQVSDHFHGQGITTSLNLCN